MARAGITDTVGGRFDLLDSNATAEVSQDSSPKPSKRRRRKSAKGHSSDQETDAGTSMLLNGSRSGSLSHGKPPLRTISELADLRSNSADVSTSAEVTAELAPGLLRLVRQSAEEVSQHTPRKPHSSMSFQDSRPATEGDCCLSSYLSPPSCITVSRLPVEFMSNMLCFQAHSILAHAYHLQVARPQQQMPVGCISIPHLKVDIDPFRLGCMMIRLLQCRESASVLYAVPAS